MANPVTLVQLSPTMSEGTIVKWLVKEGDKISSGQQIVEIETDKAVMEQDSFFDGTLLKIIAKEGAKVPVEGVIAIVGQPGEDISALGGGNGSSAPAAKGKAAAAPAEPAAAKPADVPAAKPAHSRVPPAPAKAASATAGGERVLASPLARKVAKDAGVELQGISGSGPQGRVIRRDVENAVASSGSKAVAAVAKSAAPIATVSDLVDEEIKLSGMRQTIARRLLESKQTVPHFQLCIDVRGEGLLAAVAKIKNAMP
ncbi:MAG TPA: E3 binding domain-containing protein, partial [Candidatus Sumerlaeota bacterium]|nr:E3 binding domain-containing protein [Candidatus Sumerlaeota bacterium]